MENPCQSELTVKILIHRAKLHISVLNKLDVDSQDPTWVSCSQLIALGNGFQKAKERSNGLRILPEEEELLQPIYGNPIVFSGK